MVGIKKCSSCGAENDFICDSCLFCKKPLERTDPNMLTNEELISSASEWIEKSRDREIQIDNPNHTIRGYWLGNSKPTITLSNSQIRSYASRYLSMLAYRVSINPDLLPIYDNLNSSIQQIKPKKFSKAVLMIIFGSLGYALLMVFIMYMANGESKAESKEANRIDNVCKEIEKLVAEKEYEQALVLVDQVHWYCEPVKNKEEVEQTDKRRESLKESIEKMMQTESSK